MDKSLESYYDPSHPGSFGGVQRLYNSLKDSGVNREEVKEFLSKQNTYTLHKPKRVNFPKNKIVVLHKDFQWAADLADMQKYAKENKGYRYLLTVIDVFTKYLWLRPLKDKKPASVKKAFLTIVKEGRKPLRLRTDNGTEFVNKTMLATLKRLLITHITTANKTYKAATVERVQKTMKDRMFRYFTRIGSHKYIDKLQDFVSSYNNTLHRAIKMTPNEAVLAPKQEVFRNMYGVDNALQIKAIKKPKLRKGDVVRIAYDKNVFDKGFWRTYSDQTAKVEEVLERPIPMYVLKDFTGSLKRRFYPEEVQKIPEPSYRIEKVLKRRVKDGKPQFFVKFVGYPSSENSWVDALEKV